MTHRVTSFEVLGRERNRSRDPKEGGCTTWILQVTFVEKPTVKTNGRKMNEALKILKIGMLMDVMGILMAFVG